MPENVIAARVHPILAERKSQIEMNLLAEAGGKPYIYARLQRFPSESDLSWKGNTATGVVGRRDRAFLINYTGRVINRIVKSVYSQGVQRPEIDPVFAMDATKTKETIGQFWRDVAKKYLCGQWAWVQADRGSAGVDPATGAPAMRSIAQRKAQGDRVFFALWDSTSVVDWRFGADGELDWLITTECAIENDDPLVAAKLKTIRTLWRRGGGTRYTLDATGQELSTEEFTISAPIVPFVLIGTPKATPYWMDDIERLQASIMNLDSAHHENLIKCVFPQLVLPSGIIAEIMAKSDRTFDAALELIRGIEYPLLETTEAAGLTRYLMPSAADLAAMPTESTRRRTELFEIVGQNISQETRQVASAESKAWDHEELGTSLADFAEIFEEAEEKAVAMAKLLDSGFQGYVPEYPRQFDLPNLDADTQVLERLEASGGLPPVALRELSKAKVKILRRLVAISDEVFQEAMNEIDEMDFEDIAAIAAQPPPAADPGGEPEDQPAE